MDYKNDLHSDDDFDCSNSYGDSNGNGGYSSSRLSNPGGLSKAELRKTNKPIMEKRRRARINHCLNELKSLILEAMKKDPARHTKLEKADILEMTVKHLQSVQRQQLNMAIQTDPSVIHKFKTGFVECADEVNRYISQLDGVDSGVRQRLTSHLSNCATSLEQIGSMTNFNNGYRGQLGHAPGLFGNPLTNPLTAAANPLASQVAAPAALFPPLPQDLNNNNSNQGAPIQMGGVQLIPSRLPSGEFALIVPSAAQAPAAAAVAPFPAWPAPTGLANATSPPQLNDFAASFQRMSAFSKPLHKSAFQSSLVNNNMNSNSNNNASGNNSNTTTATTTTSGSGSGNTSSPFTGGHLGAGGFHHQPQNNLHHNSTATTSPPLSPISSVSSHGDDSIMHTSSDFTIASRPATPPQDSAAVGQHSFSGVFSTPPSAESSLNGSGSGSASHLQQQQVSSTSGSESSAAVSPNGSGSAALKRRSVATDGSGSASDSSDSSDEPSAKKFLSAKSLGAELGDEDRDSMWRPW